jgi:fluoride ion exporter CrcB/FEX
MDVNNEEETAMLQPRLRMQNNVPIRKVTAGGAAGAITTIVVWILNTFVLQQENQQITAEIAAAITTLISFAVSYYVHPGRNDIAIEEPSPGSS